MNNLKKGINHSISLVLLVSALLVSSAISLPISQARASYAIKSGDKFKFLLKTIRNQNSVPIVYTIGDITFHEGQEIKLTFTQVEPPIISYQLQTDSGEAEFTFFSDIIVVNREWDALTEEFESLGYEVSNGVNIWSLTYFENGYNNDEGFLTASYYKKDGVLDNLHAYNYSPLLEFTSIANLEIDRTYTKNLLWLLSLLGLIPVGIIIGIVIKKKREQTNKKSQIETNNNSKQE